MMRQSNSDGPILSALSEYDFDELVLVCPSDGCSNENSPATHKQFVIWFTQRLAEIHKNIRITAITAPLSDLNDFSGIKNAEKAALQLAASNDMETAITVFISPGTTLMAFAWAVALRGYSKCTVKLMISPRPESKPVYISVSDLQGL